MVSVDGFFRRSECAAFLFRLAWLYYDFNKPSARTKFRSHHTPSQQL